MGDLSFHEQKWRGSRLCGRDKVVLVGKGLKGDEGIETMDMISNKLIFSKGEKEV